jgi:hypothetical protein
VIDICFREQTPVVGSEDDSEASVAFRKGIVVRSMSEESPKMQELERFQTSGHKKHRAVKAQIGIAGSTSNAGRFRSPPKCTDKPGDFRTEHGKKPVREESEELASTSRSGLQCKLYPKHDTLESPAAGRRPFRFAGNQIVEGAVCRFPPHFCLQIMDGSPVALGKWCASQMHDDCCASRASEMGFLRDSANGRWASDGREFRKTKASRKETETRKRGIDPIGNFT